MAKIPMEKISSWEDVTITPSSGVILNNTRSFCKINKTLGLAYIYIMCGSGCTLTTGTMITLGKSMGSMQKILMMFNMNSNATITRATVSGTHITLPSTNENNISYGGFSGMITLD